MKLSRISVAHNVEAFMQLGNRIPSAGLGRTFLLGTGKLLQLSRIAKADGRYSVAPIA